MQLLTFEINTESNNMKNIHTILEKLITQFYYNGNKYSTFYNFNTLYKSNYISYTLILSI